jgi:hypothetical protein
MSQEIVEFVGTFAWTYFGEDRSEALEAVRASESGMPHEDRP